MSAQEDGWAAPGCVDEDSRRHTRDVLRWIGDKWSLVVISQLMDGPLRFTKLQLNLPGISHRMLTQTVRSLERDGLVSRTPHPQRPPRVEYALTALGKTLIEPISVLADWAGDHRLQVEEHRRQYDER